MALSIINEYWKIPLYLKITLFKWSLSFRKPDQYIDPAVTSSYYIMRILSMFCHVQFIYFSSIWVLFAATWENNLTIKSNIALSLSSQYAFILIVWSITKIIVVHISLHWRIYCKQKNFTSMLGIQWPILAFELNSVYKLKRYVHYSLKFYGTQNCYPKISTSHAFGLYYVFEQNFSWYILYVKKKAMFLTVVEPGKIFPFTLFMSIHFAALYLQMNMSDL